MHGDERVSQPNLLAAAHAAAGPPSLVAAARAGARGEHTSDLRRGALWRAAWDDQAVLIVILRVSGDTVVAAPITIDPPTGDDWSVGLRPEDTTLDVACAAWAGLTMTLPWRVLDTPLGRLDAQIIRQVTDLAAEAPPVTQDEVASEDLFDPISADRAELTDLMQYLADARWAPTGEPAASLGQLLEPDAVAELPGLLGITPAEGWLLWLGDEVLTADQAAIIAGHFEVDVTALEEAGTTPVSHDLVAELDHPRWRAKLRALGRVDGLDDAGTRRETARAAVALAARSTGAPAGLWRARLESYFDSRLD